VQRDHVAAVEDDRGRIEHGVLLDFVRAAGHPRVVVADLVEARAAAGRHRVVVALPALAREGLVARAAGAGRLNVLPGPAHAAALLLLVLGVAAAAPATAAALPAVGELGAVVRQLVGHQELGRVVEVRNDSLGIGKAAGAGCGIENGFLGHEPDLQDARSEGARLVADGELVGVVSLLEPERRRRVGQDAVAVGVGRRELGEAVDLVEVGAAAGVERHGAGPRHARRRRREVGAEGDEAAVARIGEGGGLRRRRLHPVEPVLAAHLELVLVVGRQPEMDGVAVLLVGLGQHLEQRLLDL
jgi:hypothetical protein